MNEAMRKSHKIMYKQMIIKYNQTRCYAVMMNILRDSLVRLMS